MYNQCVVHSPYSIDDLDQFSVFSLGVHNEFSKISFRHNSLDDFILFLCIYFILFLCIYFIPFLCIYFILFLCIYFIPCLCIYFILFLCIYFILFLCIYFILFLCIYFILCLCFCSLQKDYNLRPKYTDLLQHQFVIRHENSWTAIRPYVVDIIDTAATSPNFL